MNKYVKFYHLVFTFEFFLYKIVTDINERNVKGEHYCNENINANMGIST